jgi:tyrosyl-tRNA synthetase
MTAGIDLIKKIYQSNQSNSLADDNVFLMTIPLLTNEKGVKFGKSEGNALWLN